jgi:hypothetical protein
MEKMFLFLCSLKFSWVYILSVHTCKCVVCNSGSQSVASCFFYKRTVK